MKTNLENLLILVFVCCITFISAQKQSIIGTVLDDSQPLPGASIKIKGTSRNTTTDIDGKFTINDIKEGQYNLQINYIGYEPTNIEVDVKSGQTIDLGILKLSQKQKNIDEVVVTGTLRNTEAKALNLQKMLSISPMSSLQTGSENYRTEMQQKQYREFRAFLLKETREKEDSFL